MMIIMITAFIRMTDSAHDWNATLYQILTRSEHWDQYNTNRQSTINSVYCPFCVGIVSFGYEFRGITRSTNSSATLLHVRLFTYGFDLRQCHGPNATHLYFSLYILKYKYTCVTLQLIILSWIHLKKPNIFFIN